MHIVLMLSVVAAATPKHNVVTRAPPLWCEPVWSLSTGSPLFQHMAVAVCVQALPIGVTVDQASKVLCLDPCRYGKQLCTFTAGYVT